MFRRLCSRLRVQSVIVRDAESTIESLEVRQLLSAAPAMNPGSPPNGPYGLVVTALSPTSVVVSFTDNADNETQFTIERSPLPSATLSSDYEPVAVVSPADGVGQRLNIYDSTVQPTTPYLYRVRADNGQIPSGFAGPVEVTTPNPGGAPNAPYNLQLIAVSPTQVNLSFVDNASNETGFVVERALAPATPTDPLVFSPIITLPPLADSLQTFNVGEGGALPNTTYFYRVRAVNGLFDSSFAGPVAITTPGDNSGIGGTGTGTPNPGGPPNAPFGATLIPQGSVTEVTFIDNSDNETGFVLQRATSPDGPWLNVGKHDPSVGKGTTLNLVDITAPTAGQTFYYRVFAVNGPFQSSIDGPLVLAGPPAPPTNFTPNAPFGLTVKADTSDPNAVDVSFIDNSENEIGFATERSTSIDGPYARVGWSAAAVGIHSVISGLDNTGLSPGTTYYYRVFAIGLGGAPSSITGPVAYTTPPAPGSNFTGVPNAPYNLTATLAGTGTIALTFTNNADNENRFVIEKATDASFGNSSFIQVNQITAAGNLPTYYDSVVVPGARYFYRVYAANNFHLSSASNTVSALVA